MGVNAWVIHGDESIWGEDAHQFRPERWLVEKEKLAYLEQHYLAVSCPCDSVAFQMELVLILSTVRRRCKNLHR